MHIKQIPLPKAGAISDKPRRKKNNNFLVVGFLLVFIVTIILVIPVLVGTIVTNWSNFGGTITNANSNKAKTVANTAGAISKSNLPNGAAMGFAYIPAGSFEMGSNNRDADERIHTVKISQGFWMGQTEVTQKQWKSLMGSLPSECKQGKLEKDFLGNNKPIICISWDNAQSFVSKLNALNDGYKYRLPTEAEWEYAARSGTAGDYAGNLDAMAWYANTASGHTYDVETKQANAWNLFDMHGNVSEWCQDLYGVYPNEAVTDPAGATPDSSRRVVRSGNWSNSDAELRSAFRYNFSPSYSSNYLGFRVVRQ